MPQPSRPLAGQLLAFDFGLRQIGVASGHKQTRIASALTTLVARQGAPNWGELHRLVTEWRPELILVGLPLNMDGSESELSEKARRFGRQIEGRTATPIEMVDERLTSREAKHLAFEHGHRGNYKEEPIDALAAQLILQQWFNEMPSA